MARDTIRLSLTALAAALLGGAVALGLQTESHAATPAEVTCSTKLTMKPAPWLEETLEAHLAAGRTNVQVVPWGDQSVLCAW